MTTGRLRVCVYWTGVCVNVCVIVWCRGAGRSFSLTPLLSLPRNAHTHSRTDLPQEVVVGLGRLSHGHLLAPRAVHRATAAARYRIHRLIIVVGILAPAALAAAATARRGVQMQKGFYMR